MSAPRLIICERSPRWLAAWRRALPAPKWNWLATAVSLTQAESWLAESPGSIVAVSLDAENMSAALVKLHEWRKRFPRARFLALLNSELGNSAPLALLHEAGVLLTIDRNEQLRSAARLVARHFRRHVAAELPLRETIWQRLPWPQFASSATE